MQHYPSTEIAVQHIVDQFAMLPQVTAIALAGSHTATTPDEKSDIDLYIYSLEQIPVPNRSEIAHNFCDQPQVDNRFWEDGDEWVINGTQLAVDITYRSPQWIEEQLDRLLVHHQVSVGCSTCFWFNVRTSKILFDRNGWFTRLQSKANQPYSDALQRLVIAKNYPVLRTLVDSAYVHQLESAVTRNDLVYIQNRIAAILTSYFDILFAVNRELNPGEKRLVNYAQQLPQAPVQFAEDIHALIVSVCLPQQILPAAHRLLDGLDELLNREGFKM